MKINKNIYWGSLFVLVITISGCFPSSIDTTPTATTIPSLTLKPQAVAVATDTSTATLVPTPTAIPLVWKQISTGDKFGYGGAGTLQLETGQGTLYLLRGECIRGRDRSTIEQPLYRSKDGGVTWEYLGKRGCFLIKDADGKAMYRLATDSDRFNPWIWMFFNKGVEWFEIRTPSAVRTLVAHPSQNGVLYAYDDQPPSNMYVSKNYGYNWEVSGSNTIRSCYGSTVYFIDAYRPMTIDPHDGNHVLYVDHGGLYESHDSCNTTSYIDEDKIPYVNSVSFDPNNSNTLYIGANGGAYVSFDGAKTWNQINDGLIGSTAVYWITVDSQSNVYAATPSGIFKLEGK